MNQKTLKLLFLLNHPVNPDKFVSNENLLEMIGKFEKEIRILDQRGFIEAKLVTIHPECISSFPRQDYLIRLTEKGKREARKIRLRII